jgi:hypothetical protein
LPLVHVTVPGKVLIDINKLLAERLVRYSLGKESLVRSIPKSVASGGFK